MKQFLRFSVSGVVGLIITAALFIGMLSLLSGNKPTISSSDTNINFSFVKDYQEPLVKPPKTLQKPVLKEVEQPPAAPKLNVDIIKDPIINTPMAGTKSNQLNLRSEFDLPGTDVGGHYSAGNPGGIKLAIPPMYPPTAMMSKTAGWVKVQISVNEFGTVSSVNILDAEPARVFNAATKKAVKKWKFHPKTIDGKTVPFQATQTIEFKLDQ